MATSKKSIKPAPKPTAKSNSPLLDAFRTGNNPHKTGGGWDKHFAFQASQEFAGRVTDSMTAQAVMKLMAEYVALAGWKNPAKALAARYGLTRYEERE